VWGDHDRNLEGRRIGRIIEAMLKYLSHYLSADI